MADGLACPFRYFRGEGIDGLSNHAMTSPRIVTTAMVWEIGNCRTRGFFETSTRIEAEQQSSFRPRCRARLSIVVTHCISQHPSMAYLHAPTG
ncbi:hypothetical protein NCU16526 [Neurospora crassa OR74A]|uniref:Uncharacterized protein n=1 Tax=Neurospora crassa (strain ATCC 24698 / 74-OR23-1A / CBS 708.71 / DSM 1257 / FGSC 987) TaxID=367110 RepID=V5INA5_NEUCR|nr:hypothetical protein NCU16526 [Neurospora crassa OR74A]ESA43527.1 hypothetical protein NCU16526 [Neurospora crassa OR74A]|eukprot:XP_011393674.1 hypothetical protein NCU16526 [Neurospora crassa OR74A]